MSDNLKITEQDKLSLVTTFSKMIYSTYRYELVLGNRVFGRPSGVKLNAKTTFTHTKVLCKD